MRGYRREHAIEQNVAMRKKLQKIIFQIAMRSKLHKIVFRLKHSCLVNFYYLWSVRPFYMVLLTYSRFILT
jgi:hypothetical protein